MTFRSLPRLGVPGTELPLPPLPAQLRPSPRVQERVHPPPKMEIPGSPECRVSRVPWVPASLGCCCQRLDHLLWLCCEAPSRTCLPPTEPRGGFSVTLKRAIRPSTGCQKNSGVVREPVSLCEFPKPQVGVRAALRPLPPRWVGHPGPGAEAPVFLSVSACLLSGSLSLLWPVIPR